MQAAGCPTISLLRQYVRGVLPEGEAAEVRQHIATCPDCATAVTACAEEVLWHSVVGAAAPEEHLRYEELLDVLEREEAVARPEHLAECSLCRQRLAEAAHWREAARASAPTPLSAGDPALAPATVRHGRLRRIARLCYRPAGAAACLLLIAAIASLGHWGRPLETIESGTGRISIARRGLLLPSGLPPLPPEARQALREAVRQAAGPPPREQPSPVRAADGSPGPDGEERPPSGLVALEPTQTIRDDRPTLRWMGSDGGPVDVEIWTAAPQRCVERHTGITELTLRVGAPLAPGDYFWVLARGGPSLTSPARFRILSGGEREQLAEAEASFRDDPLPLALVYQGLGMRREALSQYERVLERNPDADLVRSIADRLRGE